MTKTIERPIRGESPRIAWGVAVTDRLNELCGMAAPGTLARDGLTGFGCEMLPQNKRGGRPASPLHPWKVFAVGKNVNIDHFFEVYIPDGAVMVGTKEAEIEGINETDVEKRFTFDCETDIGESSTLYLVVYRDKENVSEEDESKHKAVLAVNIEEYETDGSVRAIIPIAELAVDDSGEHARGKVVLQIEKNSIRIDDVPIDKVSIDRVTDEDAENQDALQVKDFDNAASDGEQGLAERLELEKMGAGESASYKIKAKQNDSKVHLVARVNGKIKYIPISGSDEKDPDEVVPPREGDPCAHPGDRDNSGGVSPNDDEPGGDGATNGGGVSPRDGGIHPGNDDCNCD